MNKENGVYLWRVLVGKEDKFDKSRITVVPELTRVFSSKVSAMNYAVKMESKTYKDTYWYSSNCSTEISKYYRVKIEKWFGD